MRTTPEECAAIGKTLSSRLSAAPGPAVVIIPKRGWSALDVEGGPFWDPEADAALVQALHDGLQGSKVEVLSVDGTVNDDICIAKMVEKLHDMLSK
jgi:uncharacterized protein (UPF0261 family)